MKKRLFSLMLALTMLLGLLPTGALAAGEITEISTVADLQQLATEVNAGTDYSGKTVTLTGDIALDGNASSQWTPIGTMDHQFNGTFDGGYHKITGLYIDNEEQYQGLFGFVGAGGTVKNLGVSGTVSGTLHVGGVVGYNNGTVENCYNESTVTGKDGEYHNYFGGVTGYNYGTVKNCYNTGAVSGTNYVGGVTGTNSGTLENCYNTGTVTCTGTRGGVAGYNGSSASVTGCFFLDGTAVSGIGDGSSGDADAKAEAEFRQQTTFTDAGWDFTNTWEMSEELGRPIFMVPKPHSHVMGTDCAAAGDAVTFEALGSTTNLQSGKHYYLEDNKTLSGALTVSSGTVDLCLNGYELKYTGGSVITVGGGATLNICDCNGSNGSHTVTDPLDAGQNVEITGGLITGGTGTTESGSNDGGGIYLKWTGSDVPATLNLYGGTIAGNTAEFGGGICLEHATANLYGGVVSHNEATHKWGGGGVFVSLMANKTSTLNAFGSTRIEYNKGDGIDNRGGDVTLSGSVSVTGNQGGNVGGIYQNGGTLEMSGSVSVTGNKGTSYGGVHVNGGKITVSGGVQITGNTVGDVPSDLTLRSSSTYAALLNITGELTGAKPIGVILEGDGHTQGIFTRGGQGKANKGKFTCQMKDRFLTVPDGSNELALVPYAIDKQPATNSNTVTVNNVTADGTLGATPTYQWYPVTKTTVTGPSDDTTDNFDGNAWSAEPSENNNDALTYFSRAMKEGDKLIVTVTPKPSEGDYFSFTLQGTGENSYWAPANEKGVCTLTAPKGGTYELQTSAGPSVPTITVTHWATGDALEVQTSATLDTSTVQPGDYTCKVTWTLDNNEAVATQFSDEVTVDDVVPDNILSDKETVTAGGAEIKREGDEITITQGATVTTVTLPATDSEVGIDEETGVLTVPEGSKVRTDTTGDELPAGPEITVSENATATVAPGGDVCGSKLEVDDANVTSGDNVTVGKDGTITVPIRVSVDVERIGAGDTSGRVTVVAKNGPATVDPNTFTTVLSSDGTITVHGDEGKPSTTITLPENGGKVDMTNRSKATLPAGATVQTGTPITLGDNTTGTVDLTTGEVTVPGGGSVTIPDGDGGTTQITMPEGDTPGTVTPGTDGGVTAPAGSKVTHTDAQNVAGPAYTVPESGKVPANGKVEYTVTFMNGTTTVSTAAVAAGDKVQKPAADPTKDGFTFKGWYTAATGGEAWQFETATVTENTTLHAQWEAITYTVTFDAQDGTPVPTNQTVAAGGKVTKPNDPAKEGFTFKGWYTAATGGEAWQFETATVTGNTTLYAQWEAITYTVTFDAQDGTPVPTNQTVAAGGKVTKPNDPAKDGYTFKGWYTAATGGEAWQFETATVTENITLHAQWEENAPGPDQPDPDDNKLETGETVTAGDAEIKREDDKLTITKGDVETTVTVPAGGEVTVDKQSGTVSLPANSTVKAGETGPEITLGGQGGSVAPNGTVTVPEGGKVTIPAGNNGKAEISLPQGGSVDKGGNVDAEVKAVLVVDTPDVEVDGLDDEAVAAKAEEAETATVTVTMTVTGKDETTAANASDIKDAAQGRTLETYMDIKVEKTVGDAEPVLVPTTSELMTVTIPFDPTGKYNVVVYRYHGAGVDTITTEAVDGEYMELGADAITLHVKNFSTYAVGYTVTPELPEPPASGRPSRPAGTVGTQTKVDNACPKDDACPIAKFRDADADAWYHDGVHYCLEKGLMKGTSETTFEPATPTSRAMIVAILWRLQGSKVVNYAMDYPDVADGTWYTEAVRWATSEGIVTGYDTGKFGPDDPITREQLATMLWRYAKVIGQDVSVGEDTNILSYVDVSEAGEWAIPALQWATGSGVMTGKSGGVLDPQGQTTRAEAAAMLQRYIQLDK